MTRLRLSSLIVRTKKGLGLLCKKRAAGEMPERQTRRHPRRGARRDSRAESVFLNIPYDSAFERLFLAYIAAVSAFGFTPRATLEIPFSRRRLDRIVALILQSEYSVHDLSRVQLDRNSPRTPRFNMPFELGLTVWLCKGALIEIMPGWCANRRDTGLASR